MASDRLPNGWKSSKSIADSVREIDEINRNSPCRILHRTEDGRLVMVEKETAKKSDFKIGDEYARRHEKEKYDKGPGYSP